MNVELLRRIQREAEADYDQELRYLQARVAVKRLNHFIKTGGY